MKVRFRYYACIVCVVMLCMAFQQDTPTVVIRFPDRDCFVKADELGNTYLIHREEILKYSNTGAFLKRYSNKRLGLIHTFDCTNPLKILVFYKDFQQILFLDDQLTPNSAVISLENLGYEQTDLVCTSANNSFWLYSKQNNELVRFDAQLQPIVKTGNLKPILQIDLTPNMIRESNGYLYMNCPDEGILVFDIYGTFYKTYPLRQLKEFNLYNETIVFFKDRKIQQYQPVSFNTAEKEVPDTLIKNVYWQKDRMLYIYSDSVLIKPNI